MDAKTARYLLGARIGHWDGPRCTIEQLAFMDDAAILEAARDFGLPESRYVPADAPAVWREPQVGELVLVPNAGGQQQSPGRYGYRVTEVLDVEREFDREDRASSQAFRIGTRAYGSGTGPWTVGPPVARVLNVT